MQSNKHLEMLRALKFFIISVSAGIIEAVVFALFNELTSWPYWPSYLIALTASVSVSIAGEQMAKGASHEVR